MYTGGTLDKETELDKETFALDVCTSCWTHRASCPTSIGDPFLTSIRSAWMWRPVFIQYRD